MPKYHLFEDPSHGWLRVKRSELRELRIEDKISSYSYQRNDNVYLEEDMDLSTFVNAMTARGKEVKFIEHHTDRQSKIRSYESYRF